MESAAITYACHPSTDTVRSVERPSYPTTSLRTPGSEKTVSISFAHDSFRVQRSSKPLGD